MSRETLGRTLTYEDAVLEDKEPLTSEILGDLALEYLFGHSLVVPLSGDTLTSVVPAAETGEYVRTLGTIAGTVKFAELEQKRTT